MQKMETNLAHCFIICFITYADIVFASSVYMYIIYIYNTCILHGRKMSYVCPLSENIYQFQVQA